MRSDLIFFAFIGIVLVAGYFLSKRPRFFLIALALVAIPWQGGVWISFFMVDLRLVNIALILVLIHIKINGSKAGKKYKLYAPIVYPGIAIIIWALLSTIIKAYNINYGLKGVFFFTFNLLIFYCVVNTLNTPEDVKFFVKWFLIALLFQSVVALLQFTDIIFKVPILGEERAGEMYWRKSGTFLHPNQCGMYHVIMLPLALRMVIWEFVTKNVKNIIFYVLIFSIGVLGLFTTFNRGSWLALALCVIAMSGYQLFRRGKKKVKRVLFQLAILGFFGLIIFSVKYGEILTWRLFDSDVEGIKTGRYELQEASYDIIKANPILGVAPWNYQFHMTTVIFVHNLYLLLAAENGIVGLLFFFWFIFGYFREVFRGMKSKNLFVSNIQYGLFASLVGFLVASYPGPDYFISDSVGINVWALAGLAVVLNRIDHRINFALKKQKLEHSHQQMNNQNMLHQKQV